MSQQQNRRFLVRLWVLPILAVLVLVPLMAYAAWNGNAGPVAFGLCLGGAVLLLTKWRTSDARLRKLLQSPNSEPLAGFFEKAFSRARIPHHDIMLVSTVGLAHALYGEYDQTRKLIDSVYWKRKQAPPLIQAQITYLEVLLLYLEERDFVRGTALAREARDLAQVPRNTPGAAKAQRAFDAYVEIGEVLSGNHSPEVMESLREKLTQVPTLLKITIAWALETAYRNLARADDAAEMHQLRMKLAPHCLPQAGSL